MYPTPLPLRHLSESNSYVAGSNGQPLRLYQVWKGSNKFLLGGRLIFGPDVKSLFPTLFLILTPVLLFLTFVSQGLVSAFSYHIGRLIVVLCAVLTTYTIILLFLTSGRDPGIIPRNLHPPEPDDECDVSSISTDWAGSQSGAPSIPLTKNVMVNGMVVKVKYCRTCMLYRPPRCSHCSICNNCVERFDHHCPWVGQCIGRRNYRYFFMFVSSTTLLCLYVFAFCWVNIKKITETYSCHMWEAFLRSPVSGVLIVYTFVVAWFVGGLTTFHLYLIFTNQTTYENFRYRYDGKNNPYNLGCLRNIVEVLFSKTPGSKHNFRAKVKVDSFSVTTDHSTSYSRGTPSTEIPKTNFDLQIGKRQAVNADDIEGIRSHIRTGGLERCETHPRHINWDHRSNWEVTPDIHLLAAEYGIELSIQGREKHNGGHR